MAHLVGARSPGARTREGSAQVHEVDSAGLHTPSSPVGASREGSELEGQGEAHVINSDPESPSVR